MAKESRGKRLVKRYPVLASVPEEERPVIVRTALRHPLMLLLVVGTGLLLLPMYFDWIFAQLGVEHETQLLLQIVKFAVAVLLPIIIVVPLLSRFIVPHFIVKQMKKRGYDSPCSSNKS